MPFKLHISDVKNTLTTSFAVFNSGTPVVSLTREMKVNKRDRII